MRCCCIIFFIVLLLLLYLYYDPNNKCDDIIVGCFGVVWFVIIWWWWCGWRIQVVERGLPINNVMFSSETRFKFYPLSPSEIYIPRVTRVNNLHNAKQKWYFFLFLQLGRGTVD